MSEKFYPDTTLPKATSIPRALSCLNALSHGGTSTKMFIPGEDPAYFDTLMDEAFSLHQPSSSTDAGLVTDSVHARWVLWRRQRAHISLEYKLHTERGETDFWTVEDYHAVELLDRYKTHAERALRRALTNVNGIRKDEFQREHWRELLALNKDRFALDCEKFSLAKAKDARLAPKQEAESLRDAELAKDELATLEQKRADMLRKKTEIFAEVDAICDPVHFHEQLNCHVIRQTISLCCNDDGSALIDFIKPSHDQVRDVIQFSDQFETPPQFVVRTFEFGTFIPNEYTFLLDAGHKRPIKGNFTCEHTFDFERFIELSEIERTILANQDDDEE